ncbi:hypothetical protein ACFC1T_09065 [Kitasatospora sp. NPDC056076]|uniref:hypothetical protein n=1 Tax=Kitasatospora sp. NPDC056076 TaxID=3345703 RepID=UPI0035DA8801
MTDQPAPWGSYTRAEGAAIAARMAHMAVANLTVRYPRSGALAHELDRWALCAGGDATIALDVLHAERVHRFPGLDPGVTRAWTNEHASTSYAMLLPQLLRPCAESVNAGLHADPSGALT